VTHVLVLLLGSAFSHTAIILGGALFYLAPFCTISADSVDEELNENESLLIHPFVGGISIEQCVSGLDLCVMHSPCDAATLTMLQLEKSAAWENLVSIRVHDLNSLADECCVNHFMLQLEKSAARENIVTIRVHNLNSFADECCVNHFITGRRLHERWETPYQSSWTKFMGKGRFLQICTALHFNDNEDGLKSDSLHKILLYNILKKTLGAYINLGSEHSFDEATMACHSSYGRHLIVFNGMKNFGKFHFKMYMMCCAVTYLTHNIKIYKAN